MVPYAFIKIHDRKLNSYYGNFMLSIVDFYFYINLFKVKFSF